MRFRLGFKIGTVPLLACCLVLASVTVVSAKRKPTPLAPLYTPRSGPVRLLEDSYIVVLKDDVQPRVFDAHLNVLREASVAMPLRRAGAGDDASDDDVGGLERVFRSEIVKGYTGRFSKEVVEMIRMMPEVEYVEQDQIMRVASTQENTTWVRFRFFCRIFRIVVSVPVFVLVLIAD